MTYVDLRPHRCRQVQVEIDGEWLVGELEAYRQDPDGIWRGWVRWSEGVGKTRLSDGFARNESDSRTRDRRRATVGDPYS